MRAGAPCTRLTQRYVLLATVLGSSMAFIDGSVVNVALPTIQRDLEAPLGTMQWVVNAYTLCLSSLVLIGGGAGDRLGRRLIFTLGVGVFAAASVACGLASSAATLILARAVQGVGAALLIPCSLAIIGATFEERERGKLIGIWSGASAVAAGLGPVLGGWFVDHWSWRAVFLINPALAVPTLWIALSRVPESHDPEARSGLDGFGALLSFCGLGGLVYGLIGASERGWRSIEVLGPLSAGVLLLALFIRHEARSAAPMVPLELFRSREFVGVNLLTVLLYGALGGAFFFLPFALVQVHGYSATAVGATFLPFSLILAAFSRWSGGLLPRFGARSLLVVGPAISALGFALLGLPGAQTSHAASFLLPMSVLGVGMAVTVAPLTTTVMDAVPAHAVGVASGINNAVAQVASLLVIAALGSVAVIEFDHALDRQLERAVVSEEVMLAVDDARGSLVSPALQSPISPEGQAMVASIVKTSRTETVRLVMLAMSALAIAGAMAIAVLLRSG